MIDILPEEIVNYICNFANNGRDIVAMAKSCHILCGHIQSIRYGRFEYTKFTILPKILLHKITIIKIPKIRGYINDKRIINMPLKRAIIADNVYDEFRIEKIFYKFQLHKIRDIEFRWQHHHNRVCGKYCVMILKYCNKINIKVQKQQIMAKYVVCTTLMKPATFIVHNCDIYDVDTRYKLDLLHYDKLETINYYSSKDVKIKVRNNVKVHTKKQVKIEETNNIKIITLYD